MARSRRISVLRGLLWSGLVTLALSALAAFALWPQAHQRWMIHQLTSTELSQRERAINYLIRLGPDNERVQRAAIRKLKIQDQKIFLQIVAALDRAGLWNRCTVPTDSWLRWMQHLAVDKDPAARILAARSISTLNHLATNQRVQTLIAALTDDPVADVRYNALVAAAVMAGATQGHESYGRSIARLTNDLQPAIARHAWIMAGLLSLQIKPTLNYDTDPEVAEAMLWATVQANPSNTEFALGVLDDSAAKNSIREAAVYALTWSDASKAMHAIHELAQTKPRLINQENLVAIWRAVLGVKSDNIAEQAYLKLSHAMDFSPTAWLPLIELAATYRAPNPPVDRPDHQNESDLLLTLAALEGLRDRRIQFSISNPNPSEQVQLAATAVSFNPDPAEIEPLFHSLHPTMRDGACLVATQRFSKTQNTALIRSLLNNFDDRAKMSGAIVSGLTGLHSELLQQRSEVEDVPTVALVMRLGLWMQGRLAKLDKSVEALLTRDDLPTTTILLAMLHRGGRFTPAALDYLLNPHGEPQFDLIELLDQLRWWYVLKPYLPSGAPPLWVWSDPGLEDFQVDVLRDWYLINRNRLGG